MKKFYPSGFLTPAKTELRSHAARLRTEASATTSGQFLNEILETVEKIEENPFRYRENSVEGCRSSYPSARHKFRIVYKIEKDTVLIVAVAHPKRYPLYWTKRLG